MLARPGAIIFTFKDFPRLPIIGIAIPILLIFHLHLALKIAEVDIADSFLYVKKGNKQAQLPLSDILWMEYEHNAKFKLFEQPVIIQLRNNTIVGKEVYIVPKGYGYEDNNTVNEINVRIKEYK